MGKYFFGSEISLNLDKYILWIHKMYRDFYFEILFLCLNQKTESHKVYNKVHWMY